MSASPPTTAPEVSGPGPDQLREAKKWVDTTLYVFSCFFTILVYDMLVAFPQEYRCIWKARNTVVKWLYIATRYWSFVAMLITLVMYNTPVSLAQCQKYAWVEAMVPIGIVLLYQSILLARCYALWNQNKIVLYGFIGVFFVEFGFLIWVLTRLHALPYPAAVGPCVVDGDHKIITAYFLVPLSVDTLLTAVTFIKVVVMKRSAGGSALLNFFAREGLFFFLCVFGLNLANGVLYVQSNPLIRTLFAGSAFVLSSILACRLVLSLRSQDPRAPGVTGNAYPMLGSGHKTGAGYKTEPDVRNITVDFAGDIDVEKAGSGASSEDLQPLSTTTHTQPFSNGTKDVYGDGVRVHTQTTTVS